MRMTTYLNIVSTLECLDLFLQLAMRLYVMVHDYAQRQLRLPKELRLLFVTYCYGCNLKYLCREYLQIKIYTGSLKYLFRAIIMLYTFKTEQLRIGTLQ